MPTQLANALAQKKNKVTVIVPKYSYNKDYFNSNINIFFINTSQSYLHMFIKSINPMTYIKIYKLINHINPDVIHVTWDFLWFNILGFILKRKWPVVVTDHEPIPRNTEVGFFGKYIYGALRPIARNMPDSLIVHSNFLKKFLLRNGVSEDRIYVVPHGVYDYYNKWTKKEIKEEKDILFFGLIADYKGLEYLIESESLITEKVPDAKIIIAGKGDFRKYKQLIKNRHHFIIINKHIPDNEIANLFQKSSIVVLPYKDVIQSGVLTIAYSFEKPVVVTNLGGFSEIVDDGKTGIIVPPSDTKYLANAIIKLLQDKELRQNMKASIQLKVKKELCWEKIAEITEDVYKKMITMKHEKLKSLNE